MKIQHNTTQHLLRLLVLTLIILSTSSNNIIAQCCNGSNEIRIENKVDCSFCFNIYCESGGGSYSVISPTPTITNDAPRISTSINCPPFTGCPDNESVRCGGPFNPQWASINLGTNCNNCSNFKFEVRQVNGSTTLTSAPGTNIIYTNSTNPTDFTFSSTCCINGIKMSFDCSTNTLTLECKP